MEVILEIIDWILRITGLVSIIIISINLFIKEYEYIDNVKIIANPTENELNECKIYEEYISEEKSVEKTLFIPLSCDIKSLKVRKVKIVNNGKIKKGKVIKKFKRLEPYHGVLFNVTRGCAAPSYLLEWKIEYGYKGELILCANGFNGNENENIIKYNYGLISKIRKILLVK